MKGNRPKLVLAAAASAVVILLLVLCLQPREPAYQGKPLSYWLEQLQTANRPNAERAFQKFGTNAIPVLWRKLRWEFSVSRTCYQAAWDKFPAVVQMCLPPPSQLNNSFDCIVKALGALGPSSLPAMTDWLSHRSKYERLTAILVISDIDPAMWPAKQKIIEGLAQAACQQEADAEDVKCAAASALGRVGPDARQAVPALNALLRAATTSYGRAEAAVALWRIEGNTNLLPILKRELGRVPAGPTARRVETGLTEMEAAIKPSASVGLQNAPSGDEQLRLRRR